MIELLPGYNTSVPGQITEWLERSHSITYLVVIAHTLFGQMYNDLGQPDAAHKLLLEISTQVAGRDELQTTGPYLAQVARAQALLGREDEAGDAIRMLIDALNRTSHISLSVGAGALLFPVWWLVDRATSQAIDAARALLGCLERAAKQSGNSPQFEVGSSEAKGAIALHEGVYPEAVEQLQKAAKGWQGLGRPFDQFRVLNGLIHSYLHTNEIAQARAVANQGLDIIEALANELDDAGTKSTFLNSWLVRKTSDARSALAIRTAS